MLEKLWRFLLGDKWASSAAGLVGGAATGAGGAAMAGHLDTRSLIMGAVGGALAAGVGSAGRMTGEPIK